MAKKPTRGFTRTKIHDIADAREPYMAASFINEINGFSEGIPTKNLVDLIRAGAFDSIDTAIPWQVLQEQLRNGTVSEEIIRSLTESADQTSAITSRAIKIATGVKTELTTTADTPAVRRFIDGQVGKLITSVTKDSRESVRQVILETNTQRTTMGEVARRIKEVIGLRPDQTQSLNAMARQWKADGKKTSEISRLFTAARDAKLTQRAETIARTETMTAVNGGHQVGWDQAVEEGYFDPRKAKVRWVTVAVDESRLCKTCAAMNDVPRKFDAKWKVYMRNSKGAKTGKMKMVKIPNETHPNCRCTMILEIEEENKR